MKCRFAAFFKNGSESLNINIVFNSQDYIFAERSYLTAEAKLFLSGLETAKLLLLKVKVLQSFHDYRSKSFNNNQERYHIF